MTPRFRTHAQDELEGVCICILDPSQPFILSFDESLLTLVSTKRCH